MSTAVDKVLKGKERKFNRRFARLCSHYLVEPVACSNKKGGLDFNLIPLFYSLNITFWDKTGAAVL
jgi:hypothetical protein